MGNLFDKFIRMGYKKNASASEKEVMHAAI
jgi:hypothetical protein